MQVIHALGDAPDITEAVAVAVAEAARVHLVHHGLFPPIVVDASHCELLISLAGTDGFLCNEFVGDECVRGLTSRIHKRAQQLDALLCERLGVLPYRCDARY